MSITILLRIVISTRIGCFCNEKKRKTCMAMAMDCHGLGDVVFLRQWEGGGADERRHIIATRGGRRAMRPCPPASYHRRRNDGIDSGG